MATLTPGQKVLGSLLAQPGFVEHMLSKTSPVDLVQGQSGPNVASTKDFLQRAGEKVGDFLNRPIMRDPINPATGNDYNYDSMNQDAKERYQYMLEERGRQKQIELQQNWEQKNLQRSLDFQHTPFDMEPHLQRNRYM